MAIIRSMGAGKAKWKLLDNFRIIVQGCRGASNRVSALTSGTFKLLAFISDLSGGQLKNETQNVVIYSASASNTPYIGTLSSPLATHSYTANDYLTSSGTSKICFAGIIGEVPRGLSILAVGGYNSTGTFTQSLLYGPARVVCVYLAIDVPSTGNGVTAAINKNDVLIEERLVPPGSVYSFGKIVAMATGQYSVAELGSGDVLNFTSSSSGSGSQVRFAGIILYES